MESVKSDLPDQTPPEGFEPQVQQGTVEPGVVETPDDLITAADGESDDNDEPSSANNNDDEVTV